MDNIAKFNVRAGAILGLLYEAFPDERTIDCHEIVHGVPVKGTSDESVYPVGFAMPHDYQRAIKDPDVRFTSRAAGWLVDYGYFTATRAESDVLFRGAVLTPKGFAALNATPDILDGKGTVGDRLVEVSKKAGEEVGRAGIAELVGIVIGGAARVAMG